MSGQSDLQAQIARLGVDLRRLATDFTALVAKVNAGEVIPTDTLTAMATTLSGMADLAEQADPAPAEPPADPEPTEPTA